MPDGAAFTGEITATLFFNRAATRKTERRFTWTQLRAAILAATAREKAALPWVKLARFGNQKTDKGSLRHDANVIAITGIEADYDGGRVSVEEAVAKLDKAGIKAMVYTSPSHTEDAPRWRVLCPTSAELPPDRREHLVGRLNGALGGVLAGESFTLSQSYYFGSVNRNPAHRAELVDGMHIDLCDELDETWIGRPATKTVTNANGTPRKGRADAAELLTEIVTGNAFHESAVRLAGVWAASDIGYLDARKRLESAFDAIPPEQRDDRWRARREDLDRILQDIYGKEARKKDRGEKKLNRAQKPDAPDWLAKCQTTSEGAPRPNLFNCMMALRGDKRLRDLFAYDEMLRAAVIREGGKLRPVTDADVSKMQMYLQREGLETLTKDVAHQAVDLRAAERSFHPVRDYLRGLRWDGEPRIHGWLHTYLGADHNAYTAGIGKLFLVGLVARVMRPGCKMDYAAVLAACRFCVCGVGVVGARGEVRPAADGEACGSCRRGRSGSTRRRCWRGRGGGSG